MNIEAVQIGSEVVISVTKYIVTAKNGGMVGSADTITEAYELMAALRHSFPHKHYVCNRYDDDNEVLNTENF